MKTLTLSLSLAITALAQAPDYKSLSGYARATQNTVRTNIERSAAKMPEEQYSFKPTPEVRSFGAILGHIADAQYTFCAASLGEKNPAPGVEKNKTTKAELVSALHDAFAYCDRAYSALTDANAAETVAFGGGRARLGVLSFNTGHAFEHYGNLVTYLRIKGIVPPSSERR
jgi:uncharacterized damage-inducible protein DinB